MLYCTYIFYPFKTKNINFALFSTLLFLFEIKNTNIVSINHTSIISYY